MANKWIKSENSHRLYFGGPQKSLQMVTAAMKLKDTCFLEEKLMTNLDSILNSRGIPLPAKVHLVKATGFSLEKTLMLGGFGGRRRRGWQRMRWLDGITDSMDVSLRTPGVGDGQGGLACCDSWGSKESDTTERLNWTELKVVRIWMSPNPILNVMNVWANLWRRVD